MIEILFHSLAIFILLCSFAGIGMTFYLGRSKMKEIDRVVYGYEIPSDSIFFQLFRMMDYGGSFAWRFYARRIGKEWIREHFDKRYQRPFVITYYLFTASGLFIVLLYILDKLHLRVVY